MLSRRGLLLGLGATIVAPAVVRASSLMPVKVPKILTPTAYCMGVNEWVPVRSFVYTLEWEWETPPALSPSPIIDRFNLLTNVDIKNGWHSIQVDTNKPIRTGFITRTVYKEEIEADFSYLQKWVERAREIENSGATIKKLDLLKVIDDKTQVTMLTCEPNAAGQLLKKGGL